MEFKSSQIRNSLLDIHSWRQYDKNARDWGQNSRRRGMAGCCHHS